MNGSIASAISDTGATSTAGAPHDPFKETTTISSKVFLLPTGGTAKATKVAKLLHKVRAPANIVDIVPSLEHTLLSGSKFADAGYTAVYDKAEVNFYDAHTIHITEQAVLTGYRCTRTGLWRVPLQPVITNENKDTLILDSTCGHQSNNTRYKIPPTAKIRNYINASIKREKHSILNVYELPSIEQTIRYLHAAAGYPTKNTWLTAIRHGNYSTWPLITIKNVHKHFPQSEETQQGHMKNQRQGVRSTKQQVQPISPPPTHPQQNDIYVKTYDTNNTLYTDQTGKFPHVSSRGNRYQMILYHVASNSIWVEPTKNRTEGELILARSRALLRMKACNITPQHQVLDNEISAAYREAITTSAMTYQLVPPDDHRRNIAEKAIQTWKDHFVSTLSGTADNFPLHLWCQLIPQMERQLNLLRQSNNNPKISSYAHLYGHHDYNSHPFVPIGMEALVHDKPHRRKSFAQHCTKGFVLGTSPEHYRCWTVWTPVSRSSRISATVFFKHKYITNPTVTPADAIIAATANLSHVLLSNATAAHLNATQLADLTRLHNIIQPTPTEKSAVSPRGTTKLPTAPKQAHPVVSDSDSDNSPHSSKSTPLCPLSTNKQPFAYTPRVNTMPPQMHITASPRVTPPTAPAYNTRSRKQTITQETMLHFSQLPAPTVTAQRTASRLFPTEFLNAVLNKATGELMEYRHLIKDPNYSTTWRKAYDRRRDVTYGRICANFRPEKEDPHRIRLTVGGNKIHFPGDCGTPTADMLTTKILLNSIISTQGARFMTIDIKDFYLNTPMARPEFMRLKLADIPEDFITLYNLRNLATPDGYVYVRIQKGMYGLPQAGIIAQQLLESRLVANGYRQSTVTPGFWKHDWRPISFALCVDDFGVKYVGNEHAKHLLQALNAHYATSHDWKGDRYLGLTITWDYPRKQVHLSMPGYCQKAGQRFRHLIPTTPQHQPYPHTPRTYGAKQQYAEDPDLSTPLNKKDTTFVQEVIGVFLYYARAVDCTMLTALSSLATQQANPTQNTLQLIHRFLDYAMTHQNAVVTYRASNMILAVHSDASYLSETKARSRAGDHFFLTENDEVPRNNGAILTLAQIIKSVMSSAAEAELGALYINAREAIPIQHLLTELGHTQPPTPIQIDNSTALGVVTNTIQSKRTKAMDMRFHWLRCRTNQKQFRTYWRAGATNLADYVTKHHAPIHHRTIRTLYLTDPVKLAHLHNKLGGASYPIDHIKSPLPTIIPSASAA
eukprot:CCRYP_016427-RA/>CCRYP_016427-RA protein AED:0.05 eAED:0.03 QI:0/0/0/1/1/1/2/0/1237